MRALDKLLINFQDEEYFCSENINLLSKVLLYQILFTGIQLLINDIAIIMLKRGYKLQKDHDEII